MATTRPSKFRRAGPASCGSARAGHDLGTLDVSKEGSMPIYMGIFSKPGVLDKRFMGEVTAHGYEGWIELQSAQLGQSRRSAGAPGTGKPIVQEIVVTKVQDSASPKLFKEALNGEGKLVVIVFVKDGVTSMTMVLQDTLIGSYSLSGSGGDGSTKPMESMSLNFTKITFDTSPTSPDTTNSQLYKLSQQSMNEAS
jgi:type VI secretion system secreted protein Hcp